jgi:pyruvate carboxylase
MTASEPKMSSRELIAMFEASAEEAYDRMYESSIPAGCYSDFKDDFASAIGVAERAGLTEEAERLQKRLDHCRAVYRSQFSGF